MPFPYQSSLKVEYIGLHDTIEIGDLVTFKQFWGNAEDINPFIDNAETITVLQAAMLFNKHRIIAHLLENQQTHLQFITIINQIVANNSAFDENTRLHWQWERIAKSLNRSSHVANYIEYVKTEPRKLYSAFDGFTPIDEVFSFTQAIEDNPRTHYNEFMLKARMDLAQRMTGVITLLIKTLTPSRKNIN